MTWLWTSYFSKPHPEYGRMAAHPKAVAITVQRPFWFHGVHTSLLAPTGKILSDYRLHHNEDEYRAAFGRHLEGLQVDTHGFNEIIIRRDGARGGLTLHKGDILLCFEGPGKFCHRHLVARWLVRHGIPTLEWEGGQPPAPAPGRRARFSGNLPRPGTTLP